MSLSVIFSSGEARKGFRVDYQLRENYMQDGRESYFITFDVRKKKVHVATGQILIDGGNLWNCRLRDPVPRTGKPDENHTSSENPVNP